MCILDGRSSVSLTSAQHIVLNDLETPSSISEARVHLFPQQLVSSFHRAT